MSHVDLSSLRIDPNPATLPKRPWGPRLLAFATVLLLLGVGATFVWPLLRETRAVPMAPVRAMTMTGQGSTSAVAEAVGWVEADPFPHVVRPLVDGRIESIEVLEGAVVKAGETVLAHLASASLLAARDRAKVMLDERQAALEVAKANHELAVARRQQNAEARLRAAELAANVASLTTRFEMAHQNALRAAAEANAAGAADEAQRSLQASGGSYPVALQRAEAAKAAADAAAGAAMAEVQGLEHELAAARTRQAIAEEVQKQPVDLDQAVLVAAAGLHQATAALASARTDLMIAEREFGWTTVVAPVDGVVLRLLATPGADTGPRSEGILALYDRAHLRARIDVPLGSVDGIVPGQEVEVRSEVTGNTIVRGVVQRLQHESDLLKNTLQVKVGLIDAPPLLRPETLCRARFLGRAGDNTQQTVTAFVVPKTALRDGQVFVFDPTTGTAHGVAVQVQNEQGDDIVVRGDLSITHHVVLVPVTAGERLREATR